MARPLRLEFAGAFYHVRCLGNRSEIPSSQRRPLANPLQHYSDIASSRNEANVLSYSSGGYGMKEVGYFFGLHYSRVSRVIREAKRKT